MRDARMLELELILADLGAVEGRIERLEANIKKLNRAEDVAERVLFLKMKEALEAEKPLRELDLQRRGAAAAAELLVPLREADAAGGERRRGPDEGRGRAPREVRAHRLRRRSRPRALPGLRHHRGGGRAAVARGRAGLPRGPRPRGAGARPRDPHVLRAARADLVPHRGRGRVPRVDDPQGHAGAAGRGDHPLRHRARVHPRRGGRLRRPRGRGLAGRLPREGHAPPRRKGLRRAGRGRRSTSASTSRRPALAERPWRRAAAAAACTAARTRAFRRSP